MYYIVALGNPGEEYRGTRHNVGWSVLHYVIEEVGLPSLILNPNYAGKVTEGNVFGQEVTVLYPETFMNNSGTAVKKLVPKAEIDHLVVVYDEIALPIGEIKVSVGRGDGGHNGIKSIISSLGNKEFTRVRVGIAPVSFWTGKIKRPTSATLPKFVLGRFNNKENEKLEEVKSKVFEIIKTILEDGVETAMNKFN
jgi:PTH1 family peptidyl-tRNA hydrolase